MADRRINIWNDNLYTDNFKLFFDQTDESEPESIKLTELDDDKNNPINKWEFEIVGRTYIDAADENLQNQIDNLDVRVTDTENKNTEQDERLNQIEEKNTEQDERLDAIDGVNGTQTGRLDEIEQKNVEQDDRFDNIEEKNLTQDIQLYHLEEDVETLKTDMETVEKRLDTLEPIVDKNVTDIADLRTDLTTVEIELSDDVCKLSEFTIPYKVDDFEVGVYRVEANHRVITNSTTYTSPVMGLMVVNVDTGVKETYFNLSKSDISAKNIGAINVSYFNGNLDLSCFVSRMINLEGVVTQDLTDFTFDQIVAKSTGGGTGDDKYLAQIIENPADDYIYYTFEMNDGQVFKETIKTPQSSWLDSRFEQVSEDFVLKSGDVMRGSLDMNGNVITSSRIPINPYDLTNKEYVDMQGINGIEVTQDHRIINYLIVRNDGAHVLPSIEVMQPAYIEDELESLRNRIIALENA